MVKFLYDGVFQIDIKIENRKIIVSYRYNYKYNRCVKFMSVYIIKDVTKRNERKKYSKKSV